MIRRLSLALLLCLLALLPQHDAPAWQIQSKPGGVACLSVTPDTWSPTYFVPTYLTLSGSDKTLTVAAPGFNQNIIEIGVRCHTTGTWYFELNADATAGGGEDFSWGLAAATHTNTVHLGAGDGGGPLNSIGYDGYTATRAWLYNGSFGPNVGLLVPTTGQTVGVIVNLTAGWICTANVTVSTTTFYGNTNTCDPVTGTDAFTFTPFTLPMYIAWANNQNGGASTWTMNAAGPFVIGTIPSGSSPWQ